MHFVVPVFPVAISIGRFKINTSLGSSTKYVWLFSPIGRIVVTFKFFMRTIPIKIISLTPSKRTYLWVLACYHAHGECFPNPTPLRRFKKYRSTFVSQNSVRPFRSTGLRWRTHAYTCSTRPTRFQSDKNSAQNSLIF